MVGRDRNRSQREANPANQPAREPTEEEIEGVMSFVGYEREYVIAAIQMANFDLMTAQNLLLDNIERVMQYGE